MNPQPEIYSPAGCLIRLLGRKRVARDHDEVFARRLSDNAIRVYEVSTLRFPGGSTEREQFIATLPLTTLKSIKSRNL